jgi:C1A family cysteine protease
MESVQVEHFNDVMMPLSPLFQYYNTRKRLRTVNQDSGASLRDAVKTAVTYGVCAEEEWPYDVTHWKDLPSQVAYDDVNKTKIIGYYRIDNFQELKQSLAAKNPVVFGAPGTL